jgi:hypothetical protein
LSTACQVILDQSNLENRAREHRISGPAAVSVSDSHPQTMSSAEFGEDSILQTVTIQRISFGIDHG